MKKSSFVIGKAVAGDKFIFFSELLNSYDYKDTPYISCTFDVNCAYRFDSIHMARFECNILNAVDESSVNEFFVYKFGRFTRPTGYVLSFNDTWFYKDGPFRSAMVFKTREDAFTYLHDRDVPFVPESRIRPVYSIDRSCANGC